MSPIGQARTNRSRRQGFSGRYSCSPWVHHLNLYRGYIGDDCGNPLNMDCDREHSGADCGKFIVLCYVAGILCSGVGVG